MKCIRPKYFNKFKCDGKSCESRCCKNWRIVVDSDTYKKYSDSDKADNILPYLEFLNDEKIYIIKHKANGDCTFLDDDSLCKLQKQCGESFLTAICDSYPRIAFQIEDTLEQSLTLTCPIAAKLILLPTEPIEFEETEVDEPRFKFDWTDKTMFNASDSVDLQMRAIKILQDRQFSIDERLFNLYTMFDHKKPPFSRNFDSSKYVAEIIKIFDEMYNANMNEQKRAELQKFYLSYYLNVQMGIHAHYGHIFENYLVNEFFMRCYPFAFAGDFWLNCRIFIIAFKSLEFAIILKAISQNGKLATDEILTIIDAMSEKLDHNRGGMRAICDFAEKFTNIDDVNKFV